MTIREAEYFEYAGLKSLDFGISNVSISTGLYEEPFSYSRSIVEDSVRGRSKPYFQGLQKEPLKFSVSFAFDDTWDPTLIRRAAHWLTEQTYYQPLVFSSDPEKIYYALAIDDPNLVHNGLNQGYVTLTFRCNDAYAYSPVMLSRVYEWKMNPLTIDVGEFADGTLHHLQLDSQLKLTLPQTRPKWNDYGPTVRWTDI